MTAAVHAKCREELIDGDWTDYFDTLSTSKVEKQGHSPSDSVG